MNLCGSPIVGSLDWFLRMEGLPIMKKILISVTEWELINDRKQKIKHERGEGELVTLRQTKTYEKGNVIIVHHVISSIHDKPLNIDLQKNCDITLLEDWRGVKLSVI